MKKLAMTLVTLAVPLLFASGNPDLNPRQMDSEGAPHSEILREIDRSMDSEWNSLGMGDGCWLAHNVPGYRRTRLNPKNTCQKGQPSAAKQVPHKRQQRLNPKNMCTVA